MATMYQYKYAYITETGLCIGMQDTSDLYLSPRFVPIEDDTIDYGLKYYWPIPETVTSFDDWQGLWYLDAAHTQLFEEGNA
jgi:hypothetical protein